MKKMPYIRSLRNVRSAHDARLCSIPKQQRSIHLDLYVLAREKERLEKELFQQQIKVRLWKKRLTQSNKRMSDLMKEIIKEQGLGIEKKDQPAQAKVKKMRIDY